MFEIADIQQMEKVISMAIAPSFLIGGITTLMIAVMIARLNSIIGRSRSLHGIAEGDPVRGPLRADIPRPTRRAGLINRAILLAIGSALTLTLLVIQSFVVAFFGLHHIPGAAALFALSLCLLAAALVTFACEVRQSLTHCDHHPC